MDPVPRPIFRTEAVQRYAERHEQAVLPRLVRPRVFRFLWLLLGLLLAAGTLVWFVGQPVRAIDSATATSGSGP